MASIHGSDEADRHEVKRSSQWPKVEHDHLKQEPSCACCGTTHGVQVHHIFPFHYVVALGRPDLELDQRNLITLCETEAGIPNENHHLLLGHLDSFKSNNISVKDDVIDFKAMTAGQITATKSWQDKVANRLKPLDEFTDDDRNDFIRTMNEVFPL